jgi:hypothetical protein
MDTIAIRTSNSIPTFEFTPSHEVSPSAAAPPNNGIANGMVQQATQAPAKPSVARFLHAYSPIERCGLIPVNPL